MDGKRIVLCGAASERGGYVAEVLRQRGHRVFGVGLHGPDYAVDFALAGDDVAEAVFSRAFAAFDGFPDTLVILSSRHFTGEMADHTPTIINQGMSINFVVPFLLLQRFCDNVDKHRVDNASAVFVLGAGNTPHAYTYNASKAALRSVLKTLSLDLVEGESVPVRLFGIARTCPHCSPHNRPDAPSDMANVVVYMIEDAPAFMSGTVLTLGGGVGG